MVDDSGLDLDDHWGEYDHELLEKMSDSRLQALLLALELGVKIYRTAAVCISYILPAQKQ